MQEAVSATDATAKCGDHGMPTLDFLEAIKDNPSPPNRFGGEGVKLSTNNLRCHTIWISCFKGSFSRPG
jgi:hypothetical protein